MSDFRTIARALVPYVREGMDLLDATDAVIASLATPPTFDTHESRVQAALASEVVMDCIRQDKKIHAIKELRALTTCGLKDAKEAVEDSRIAIHYPFGSSYRY